MATEIKYDVVESRTSYRSDALQLVVDTVKDRASGKESSREVVVKGEFVIVVPYSSDSEFVCVRQAFHPFQQSEVSFPTVALKDGETPEDAARRSLAQCGCSAKRIVRLATLNEAPDTMRSVGHTYAALDLEYSKSASSAPLDVLRLNEAEFRRLLRRGEVQSGTTASAFFMMLDFQDRSRLTGVKSATGGAVADKGATWHCPVMVPFVGWSNREKFMAGITLLMFLWARYRKA